MLTIIFDSGNHRTWNIGDKSPIVHAEANAVREIQADGEELKHIKEMFDQPKGIYGEKTYPLIPMREEVRLFGDLAKTIVANLI